MKELREHLKDKLDIGDRQLRRLIAAKAAELPSSNQQALFVLAHENRMRLSDYLTPAQIAEVRDLVQGRPVSAPPVRSNGGRVARTRAAASAPTAADLVNINVPPGLLSPRHVREAERMSRRVYPLLYVFENSIREFIDGHLAAIHGQDWYEQAGSTLVSGDVRRAVERARRADDEERWHSARNARAIYYTELGNLALIVTSQEGWRVFGPPRFPRQSWFTELIHSAQVSRNIVAHMNPLQPADVTDLERNVRKWFRQIRGDEPPALT